MLVREGCLGRVLDNMTPALPYSHPLPSGHAHGQTPIALVRSTTIAAGVAAYVADGLHCVVQGYMVGNGCTDQDFDGNAQVPFAVGKSLISTTLYQRVEAACKGNYWDVEEGSRCGSFHLTRRSIGKLYHNDVGHATCLVTCCMITCTNALC